MKNIKIVGSFLLCLIVANCVPNVFAGVSPRPAPINYYDPCSTTTSAFYPYGWYTVNKRALSSSDTVYSMVGNTLVVSFGNGSEDLSNLIPVLDMARLYGKKVVVALTDPTFFQGVNPATPSTYAALAQFINAGKNHPALLGWLMGDENEYNFPGTAQDIVNSAYVINHVLDGHHQVWQIFSQFGVLNKQLPYLDGTTVYSQTTYPNHSTSFEPADIPNSFLDIEHYYNPLYAMGQKAVDNSASCALITQGFGDMDLAPTEMQLTNWRLPTHKEYRWNVFSAITSAGSRGTIDWLCELGFYSDPYVFQDWRDAVANPVGTEQAMITHGMETGYNVGTVAADWTSKTADYSGGWVLNYDRITHLLVYDELTGKYFLIVTNNGSASQNVQLTISNLLASLENTNVLVYDEAAAGETITLADLGGGSYGLSDTIPGFEVMIYRFNAISEARNFIGNTGSGWDTNSVVTAAPSSNLYGRGGINLVDGGGISEDGLTHNANVFHPEGTPVVESGGMWLSGAVKDANFPWVNASTHWVQFAFDKVYAIDKMWIWNYNENQQTWDGPSAGMKRVRILASTTDDQAGWTYANAHPVFEGIIPRANGTGLNPVNLIVNFGGLQARYVLIASVVGSDHNWRNDINTEDGLSEVRFYRTACSVALDRGLGFAGDVNKDCYVNFKDLVIIAQSWLQCVQTQAGCN